MADVLVNDVFGRQNFLLVSAVALRALTPLKLAWMMDAVLLG